MLARPNLVGNDSAAWQRNVSGDGCTTGVDVGGEALDISPFTPMVNLSSASGRLWSHFLRAAYCVL